MLAEDCEFFLHPRVFDNSVEVPLEFCNAGWAQTSRVMGLPRGDREKCLISLAFWIQYTGVTDRQTDKQRNRHWTTASTALCIASRGKKMFLFLRRFRISNVCLIFPVSTNAMLWSFYIPI